MTPKRPLIESKRTPFLKNKHILTPNHDSRESRLASKTKTKNKTKQNKTKTKQNKKTNKQKQKFFRVSLVAHVYKPIILVAPGLHKCRVIAFKKIGVLLSRKV